MASTREQQHHAAVVRRYGVDLSTYAASAIEVAKAGEAARKPSGNEAAPVAVKATVTPNRWGAIAVDTNGLPVDSSSTVTAAPVIRLRGNTK